MSWTKSQELQFAQALLAIGELLDVPVSAARAEMFCRLVEDLPFDLVHGALQQHAQSSRFFPKPADLRELIDGNTDDRAEIAWLHVIGQVRRVGYTGRPTWPDEATERAALGLFGSWRRLCENLPSGSGETAPALLGYAKQFKASFAAASRRDAATGALPPSSAEAQKTLGDLKKQLDHRGLPTGGL